MKMVYRVLAYLISLGVALQAAAVAIGFFGLAAWVENGGVLDKAGMESQTISFGGLWGLEFHGTVGIMVIPALGLLLVISSFFTKVRGAVTWALIVLGCIVVQIALGLFAHSFYVLGFLHGLFAFAVLAAATIAATRVARAVAPSEPPAVDSSSIASADVA
jgi:hypothetical protein